MTHGLFSWSWGREQLLRLALQVTPALERSPAMDADRC
jgi:hypothetical protein